MLILVSAVIFLLSVVGIRPVNIATYCIVFKLELLCKLQQRVSIKVQKLVCAAVVTN